MNKVIDIKQFINLNSQAIESFNVLNANIRYGNNEKEIKTLCVTSYNKGEGKTTVALNLAVSLARIGKKVLFVDSDLRNTSNKPYVKENVNGVSNLLDDNNFESNKFINETNINQLHITTSSDRIIDSVKVFSSNQFDEFLLKAKEKYDYIILDTPSLGNYIDGAILASKCDGTIIVAKSQVTQNKQITRIKDQIEKVNGNILGIVLNQMPKREFKKYFVINGKK